MGMFRTLRAPGLVPGLALTLLLGIDLAASGVVSIAFAAPPNSAPAAAQQSFVSADAAAEALVKALQADDVAALRTILGPGGEKLVASGDPIADATARKRVVDAYTASHALTPAEGGRMVLVIGADAWPLPIPLAQVGDRWRFDSLVAAQEIVDRRIGRNELMTIRTLLAAVEAEKDYFDRMQRGTGTGAYAQRMLSTPGKQDGLYWEVAAGEAPSPLGPLLDQAQSEGYPGATATNGKVVPYHGYLFRLLKAQGPSAPGGAKAYVQNGQMTGGFAFVAWPAVYATSGVTTFLIDQDGVVFQKDLGPNTAKIVSGTTRFDPDLTWARVDISD
jgi:hypothetical protein